MLEYFGRKGHRRLWWLPLFAGFVFVAAGCSFRGNTGRNAQEAEEGVAFLTDYAQAYCDRDAERVVDCYLHEETAFEDVIMLEKAGGSYTMGYSSPWPDEFHFVGREEKASGDTVAAEIWYYAWTSDPHVTVWKEDVQLEKTADGYRITDSNIRFLDSIDTKKAFIEAYLPADEYRFADYEERGYVEAINIQTAEGGGERNAVYRSPDTAAAWILNLTGGEGRVETPYAEQAVVYYTFGDGSSVEIPMKNANEGSEEEPVWVPDLAVWNAKAP